MVQDKWFGRAQSRNAGLARRGDQPRSRTKYYRLLLERLEDRLAPAVVSWDGGGGDFNWNNRFNWNSAAAADSNTLPSLNDDVTIQIADSSATIVQTSGVTSIRSLMNSNNFTLSGGSLAIATASTLGQSVIVGPGSSLTVSGAQTMASLTVGGTITHFQGDIGGLNLQVAGRVEVQAGGMIDVTAKGYRGAFRDGNVTATGETFGAGGVSTLVGGSTARSGGSYGSPGSDTTPNALYGLETAPAELGSGGGSLFGVAAGNGGGRIQLTAGSVVIDGQLLADGGGGSDGAGGGSGGAILVTLTGGTFSGSGTIRAGGGGGYFSGAGGNGRIAILGFSTNTFTGTLGQAGTKFVQAVGTGGELTLDGTSIVIASGETKTWGSISAANQPSTIINRGTLALTTDALTIPSFVTLIQDGVVKGAARADATIGSLTILSGGLVTQTRGLLGGVALSVAGILEVQAGGMIDVTAKGYRGAFRDGNATATGETFGAGGVATLVGGSTARSGGSYGSPGSDTTPNALYGLETAPAELGSGGGSLFGVAAGNGGGRMQLTAGSVVIDGQLLADGGGGDTGAGGGSGGAILVTLTGGTFSGSGTIRAGGGGRLLQWRRGQRPHRHPRLWRQVVHRNTRSGGNDIPASGGHWGRADARWYLDRH